MSGTPTTENMFLAGELLSKKQLIYLPHTQVTTISKEFSMSC